MHAADRPADAAAPVVVGAQRFTVAQLTAARRRDGDVRSAAERLIHRAWIAREAAARGLVAPAAVIDAAVVQDRRQATTGRRTYAAFLAGLRETADQRRSDIAAGVLEELVVDAVVREAGPGAPAFGRAFQQLADRERAATTCLPAYAPKYRDACSNQPADPANACTQFGIDDVCAYPPEDGDAAYWGGEPDLIVAFMDPPKAAKAANDPDGDRALTRLRRYLRTHAPAALRRCDFDPDDLAYYSCPTQQDAIAVLYGATRIHVAAQRTWTVPATAGVIF